MLRSRVPSIEVARFMDRFGEVLGAGTVVRLQVTECRSARRLEIREELGCVVQRNGTVPSGERMCHTYTKMRTLSW